MSESVSGALGWSPGAYLAAEAGLGRWNWNLGGVSRVSLAAQSARMPISADFVFAVKLLCEQPVSDARYGLMPPSRATSHEAGGPPRDSRELNLGRLS
jgi:hypothetical protein